MKKKNTQRILALLLAIVMAVGLLPLSALADAGGGNSGGQFFPDTGGSGGVGWGIAGYFTRYTLVEFPSGIDGDNWKNYEVKGSVDIVPDGMNVSNTAALRLNAMDYRLALDAEDSGEFADRAKIVADMAESGANKVWWDSQTKTVSSIFGDTLPSGSTPYDVGQMCKGKPSSYNPLLSMFGNAYDGSSIVLPKGFNEVMRVQLFDAMGCSGYDFQSKGDQTCRLLVEPGIVLNRTSGADAAYQSSRYALTVRDAAAVEFSVFRAAGHAFAEDTFKGQWADKAGHITYNMQNILSFRLGYALYENQDGFTTINGTTLVTKSSPAAFAGAKGHENEVGTVGSSTARLMALSLFKILMGCGTYTRFSAWSVDDFAPYGLGILLPEQNAQDASLTVTKTVDGATADKNATFNFEVRLSNLPAGATVSSDTEGFAYADGKATFVLKDGEFCKINILGLEDDGKTVRAAVTETNAASQGYEISYNGEKENLFTIGYNQDIRVDVTNTRNFTALNISKSVEGGFGERNVADKLWVMDITLSDNAGNPLANKSFEGLLTKADGTTENCPVQTDAEGKIAFWLHDGEKLSILFNDLAEGERVYYVVRENEANQNGYMTIYEGNNLPEVTDGAGGYILSSGGANVNVRNVRNGLVIKKVVSPEGKGSYPDGTEFVFGLAGSTDDLDGGEVAKEITTPVTWGRFAADGTFVNGGVWDNLAVATGASFTLKDGECVHIYGFPPETCWIQPTEVSAKLPDGTTRDISGENVTITWDGDGATKSESTANNKYAVITLNGNQAFAPNVTFTNGMEAGDNRAHLIIDYNFNGAWATIGDGTTSATVDCGYVPYDFADATKNVVHGIKPSLNGEALTVGKEYSDSVTCAKCGGTATMTYKYKGLYDAPTGGNAVGDGWPFRPCHLA